MPVAPRHARGSTGIVLPVTSRTAPLPAASRPAPPPAASPARALPAPRTAARLPPSPLVRPADVGPVAWHLLLRDGHLVRLRGDVALPARVRATPALRAAALAPLVPPRCAVARAAAVWVHVGGAPPARVDVVAPSGGRVPDPAPGRAAAATPLPAADVVLLGGVRVTTPRRTAVDLLSHDPPERALPLVARLRAAGLDPARVRADVATAVGRRGVRAAAALVPRLAPPPDTPEPPGTARPPPAAEPPGGATPRRPAAPPSPR